jgi:hypothetical protein
VPEQIKQIIQNPDMNLIVLLKTIATVRHELRLLREAFSPDVVTGKKKVKLPKYCWRDAVLNVVWPDGLPNALQNHFCPLFWVSNLFPLLWAWVFLKFVGRCIARVANGVVDKIDDLAAASSEKRRKRKKEDGMFKFLQEIETLSPALIWKHLFDWTDTDWDWLEPEQQTLETKNFPVHYKQIMDWEFLSDYKNYRMHLAYKLHELYGSEWIAKAFEIAKEYQKQLQAKKEQEKIQKIKREEFKSLFTLKPAAKAVKDSVAVKSALTSFQRVQQSRQVAKITEMSHVLFKYGFIIMSSLLAMLMLVVVYNFAESILWFFVQVFEWLTTLAAVIYLNIYGILATILGCLAVGLVVFLFVKTCSFLFETKNGAKVRDGILKSFVVLTSPIWWPIVKGAGIMVDVFEFLCNLAKITYHDNCPAIEREENE